MAVDPTYPGVVQIRQDGNLYVPTGKTLNLEAGAGFGLTPVARTATADGLTTGTIESGPSLQVVQVTSAAADNIIVLPAPTPGAIVVLIVSATGYELRSSAPATVGINGGTGTAAEAAIPADTTAILVCESATNWKGFQMSAATGTLAKVQVAAP